VAASSEGERRSRGNLVYTPDQFGGGYNDGEFTVSGTSFTPNKLVIARKYYAGVGMRENGTLYWLLTDHLGGTNVTVTTAGGNMRRSGTRRLETSVSARGRRRRR
jgi:hypothetical protein